jgi:hypothetical protein
LSPAYREAGPDGKTLWKEGLSRSGRSFWYRNEVGAAASLLRRKVEFHREMG